MKHYTLAIQTSLICTTEERFEHVFSSILVCALGTKRADKRYKEGSRFCAEVSESLTISVDTSDDFKQISDYYRKNFNRNANLRISLDVYDETAFPYFCSNMAKKSCDDVTLTDEKGLVFTVHNHTVEFGNVSEIIMDAFRQNLENAGITVESIFPEFDAQMDVSEAINYAEEHFNDFITARTNAAKKVYTTRGYELGIACPSLVKHRVVGGHKRGRIMKRTPDEGENYCIIGYDTDDKPLFFTSVNSFGTAETNFFFELKGYIWAMELHECDDPYYNGKHCYGDIYKFRYDSKGRIEYYAVISPSSVISEKYEYSDDSDIICHFYYYVPNRTGCYRNIPAGFENSPMTENLYEISPDLKRIREYDKMGDEYVFSREIVSSAKKSKNPKPADDSFDKFSVWLDNVLSGDIPEKGGIYFDLCEPFEDGFSFAFEICEIFDKEDDDWACSPVYSTDFYMINTNGQLEWEKALKHTAAFIRKYLCVGEKKNILKKYQGIGVGFSDSDITYIR